jgi:hypothetical protein
MGAGPPSSPEVRQRLRDAALRAEYELYRAEQERFHAQQQRLKAHKELLKAKAAKLVLPQAANVKAKAGFPSIAGVWQEGPAQNQIRITVSQTAEKFTATCTYQDKKFGKISWRMTGTISTDGEIKGNLVHIRAPRGWLAQTRTGKFSATDGTITGHATFQGGGHDFKWKLLDNK